MARLFVPLDVNHSDDPKIMRAGAFAELVYLRSLALAKRLDDDGRIDECHLRRLCDGLEVDPREIAETLCRELWVREDGGFRIAAWLKHNPSSAELQAQRDAEAERGRQRRASARTAPTVQPDAECRPAHEVKRSESEETLLGEFETWWSDYPQKKDRAAAFKAFKARRRADTPLGALCVARDNYLASEALTETQFLKRGATFLNGADGPWLEWSTKPAPEFRTPTGRGDAVRPQLGRGLDAEPLWLTDENGDLVYDDRGDLIRRSA